MLEYYVYNNNSQEIVKYNVFDHSYFVRCLAEMFNDIEREKRSYIKNNHLKEPLSLRESSALQKYMLEFEDDQLRRWCLYAFWAKAEYEIVLTTWTPSIDREELIRLEKEDEKHIQDWGKPAYRYTPNLSVSEKIDIYDQLKLNWSLFKNYVFDNEKEIKKLNRENLKKYPSLKKS